MAPEEPLSLRAADVHDRIDNFFDCAELVVKRTERLIMQAKYLIFGLAFLLFLIYEMFRFGVFLLGGH